MATKRLLVSVFAPEGWPTSVAPEYGRYQLWDTIQQVRLFFWQQGKATKYSWFCGNGWSFCWIFGQDCDLESKSADAWMICLFSCIRTASINGTTTTAFASFWRRWPSSWTLLLSFDILTWWLWWFFSLQNFPLNKDCSDLKVISKQAEIFMKGRWFVECWDPCLVLSICAWFMMGFQDVAIQHAAATVAILVAGSDEISWRG